MPKTNQNMQIIQLILSDNVSPPGYVQCLQQSYSQSQTQDRRSFSSSEIQSHYCHTATEDPHAALRNCAHTKASARCVSFQVQIHRFGPRTLRKLTCRMHFRILSVLLLMVLRLFLPCLLQMHIKLVTKPLVKILPHNPCDLFHSVF